MGDPEAIVVGAWIEKAERDLASARRLLDGTPPYLDTAVYHCQQASEKALKAFLAAHGQPIRRVHEPCKVRYTVTSGLKLLPNKEHAIFLWFIISRTTQACFANIIQ